jgi:hypothetical protein
MHGIVTKDACSGYFLNYLFGLHANHTSTTLNSVKEEE